MAWEFSVLVVANVTATADELMAALRERAEKGPCRFVLVVPAAAAEGGLGKLDAALEDGAAGARAGRRPRGRAAIRWWR